MEKNLEIDNPKVMNLIRRKVDIKSFGFNEPSSRL